jgi:hypothetical protein
VARLQPIIRNRLRESSNETSLKSSTGDRTNCVDGSDVAIEFSVFHECHIDTSSTEMDSVFDAPRSLSENSETGASSIFFWIVLFLNQRRPVAPHFE